MGLSAPGSWKVLRDGLLLVLVGPWKLSNLFSFLKPTVAAARVSAKEDCFLQAMISFFPSLTFSFSLSFYLSQYCSCFCPSCAIFSTYFYLFSMLFSPSSSFLRPSCARFIFSLREWHKEYSASNNHHSSFAPLSTSHLRPIAQLSKGNMVLIHLSG